MARGRLGWRRGEQRLLACSARNEQNCGQYKPSDHPHDTSIDSFAEPGTLSRFLIARLNANVIVVTRYEDPVMMSVGLRPTVSSPNPPMRQLSSSRGSP
jgi:hypothetical protein